jgi:hypothetical protein
MAGTLLLLGVVLLFHVKGKDQKICLRAYLGGPKEDEGISH